MFINTNNETMQTSVILYLCVPPFVIRPCGQRTCKASSGGSVGINLNTLQLARKYCHIAVKLSIKKISTLKNSLFGFNSPSATFDLSVFKLPRGLPDIRKTCEILSLDPWVSNVALCMQW
jgi:hypothetical protein